MGNGVAATAVETARPNEDANTSNSAKNPPACSRARRDAAPILRGEKRKDDGLSVEAGCRRFRGIASGGGRRITRGKGEMRERTRILGRAPHEKGFARARARARS